MVISKSMMWPWEKESNVRSKHLGGMARYRVAMWDQISMGRLDRDCVLPSSVSSSEEVVEVVV